jgi:hypothetical protein
MNLTSLSLVIVVLAGCQDAPAAAPSGDPPASLIRAAARAEPLELTAPRASHAEVMLADGRVLLIGGCTRGRCEAGEASATVDIFDPRTMTVSVGGRLVRPRIGAAAAVLPDGRVLIAGGWSGSSVSASTEIFDPRTGRSTEAPPLPSARADIAVAVLPGGRVLLAGGFDGSRASDMAEIYDPPSGAFLPAGRLGVPRTGAAAALLPDGRVLLAGGGAGARGALVASSATEVYDPASNRFSRSGALNDRRYKHAAVTLQDGRVLVVGGSDERDYSGKLRSLELYDPATRRFTRAGATRAARFKLSDAVVVLRDGRVLIAGGASHPEVFDPADNSLRELEVDLGGSWNYLTATLLPDGRALLAGGYREGEVAVSRRAWVLNV